MTDLLAGCAGVAVSLVGVTALLLVIPVSRWELRMWHALRVAQLRRWLTRSRNAAEPLRPESTIQVARRNLGWHLLLTMLFSWQLAMGAALEKAWWRSLTLPLVLPCAAYLAGSLVQRQKIAIIRVRSSKRGRL